MKLAPAAENCCGASAQAKRFDRISAPARSPRSTDATVTAPAAWAATTGAVQVARNGEKSGKRTAMRDSMRRRVLDHEMIAGVAVFFPPPPPPLLLLVESLNVYCRRGVIENVALAAVPASF